PGSSRRPHEYSPSHEIARPTGDTRSPCRERIPPPRRRGREPPARRHIAGRPLGWFSEPKRSPPSHYETLTLTLSRRRERDTWALTLTLCPAGGRGIPGPSR